MNRKKFLFSIFIFFILFSTFCGNIHVRTQGNTPHEELAARELKNYGGKVSASSANFFLATMENKKIPPFITEKLKKSPHKEAFYIYTLPSGEILIAGKTKWGILFGTYEFIRKYWKVYWLFPGEAGECLVEKSPVIPAKLDEFHAPGMKIASSWVYSGMEKRKVPWKRQDAALWLLRNKAYPGFRSNDVLVNKVIPPPAKGGGGHLTFELAVPNDPYYKTNPEYFPLIHGKRLEDKGHHGKKRFPVQRCVSHPGVKKLVTDYISSWTLKNPGAVFSMGAADNPGVWCQCPSCIRMATGKDGKYNASNLYHAFYSEIAREVYKRNPEAKLYIYIYLDYRDLPTKGNIKYDDRIIGRYCAHGRCIAHTLDDKKCEMNPRYHKEYLAWKKLAKNAALGDYYFNSNVPYCPHEYVFAADLKNCAKYGEYAYGTHITDTRVYTNWQYVYCIAALAWTPYVQIDRFMDVLYSAAYGKAAVPMKKYHALRRKLWENAPGHAWYPGPNRGAYCLVLPANEKKLLSLLAEAEKLADGEKNLLTRIAMEKDNLIHIWGKEAARIRKMRNARRDVPASPRKGKIVIDGKINEEDWQKAGVLDSFRSVVTKDALAEDTHVRVLYDKDCWYISIVCMNDKGVSPLVAKAKVRDQGISLDDAVEFFIAPPGNAPYYHFMSNSIGTIYDARLLDKSFDSRMELKTSIEKDRWIVEAKIPVKPMNVKEIRNGELWQMHFWRTIRNLLPPADMDRGGIDGTWPHKQPRFRFVPIGRSVIKNGSFTEMDGRKGFAKYWGVGKRGGKNTVEILKESPVTAKFHKGGLIYQHFALLNEASRKKGHRIDVDITAKGKGELLFYINTFIDSKDEFGKFKRTPVKRPKYRKTFPLTDRKEQYKLSFDLIASEQCYIYLRSDDCTLFHVSAFAAEKDISSRNIRK